MTELTIGFVPLARLTFDIPLAESITATVRSRLIDQGYRLAGPNDLVTNLEAAAEAADSLAETPIDLLLVLQSTFADSTMIVRLTESITAPILMWAIPEAPTGGRLRLNSLCGVNLGGHALTLRKRGYDYAYAAADDEAVLGQVEALAKAGLVQRKLQETKVGLVGQHPDGMDTCHLDTAAISQTFGTEVAQYPLEAVFSKMAATPAEAVAPLRTQLAETLPNLDELEQAPLNGTLSAFHVLQNMSQEDGLSGFAVRCWPEFFEQNGCAACGAMSMLNDSHIPAACEADINGTITQLILQWISDGPAFGTDVVSADLDNDFMVIWHCGKAPLSMADPEAVTEGGIHSNRKVPLVMEFPLRPGRVTAARISRASGELRLVVGSGTMLQAGKSFTGTSGQLRFDSPAGDVLDKILGEGLEHHIAITYGDHVPALLAVAKQLNLPVLHL